MRPFAYPRDTTHGAAAVSQIACDTQTHTEIGEVGRGNIARQVREPERRL